MTVNGVFWSDNQKINDRYWIDKAKELLNTYWDNHIVSSYDMTKSVMQSSAEQNEVILAIERYKLACDYFVTVIVAQLTHAYLKDGAMLGGYFNQFINRYMKQAYSVINEDLDELACLYQRQWPSMCL